LEYADKALKYKPKRIALWEKKAKFTLLGQSRSFEVLQSDVPHQTQAKKYVIFGKFAIKHNCE